MDALHIIPVVRTLQHVWPNCRLTWVTGKENVALLEGIEGLEVIALEASPVRAVRQLRSAVAGKVFDVLLNMQQGWMANLLSVQIHALVRLGFDRQRSRRGQTLVCNGQISGDIRVHPVDMAFQFLEALGIEERQLVWDLPVGPEVEFDLPEGRPVLLLAPCVDHCQRAGQSWSAENYASLCDFALQAYNMKAVVVGGGSAEEALMAQHIQRFSRAAVINLCGKLATTALLQLIGQSSVVVGVDSEALHLATAAGRPAVGLFAHRNPACEGPYLSQDNVVDQYAEAVLQSSGKTVDEVTWGYTVSDEEVIELIRLEDVIEKLSAVMDAE